MLKLNAILLCCFSLASAGVIETHHVVHEPVLTKIGTVIHNVPSSAISHQSFTRIHNQAIETPIVSPGIKTTIHHHTAPTLTTHVKDVETLEQVESADNQVAKTAEPVVKTVETNVPLVKSSKIVHTYNPASTSIVHSVPFVKTIVPATSYTYIQH